MNISCNAPLPQPSSSASARSARRADGRHVNHQVGPVDAEADCRSPGGGHPVQERHVLLLRLGERRTGIGEQLRADPRKTHLHRPQAIALRAQVQLERAPVQVRDLVVMLRFAEDHGFRFDVGDAVLREIAAGRDEQVLVPRRRVEQRLVEFQPERDRIADELQIVVSREHVAARRERAGDHADSLALHERTARRHGQGACGNDQTGDQTGGDRQSLGRHRHAEVENSYNVSWPHAVSLGRERLRSREGTLKKG